MKLNCHFPLLLGLFFLSSFGPLSSAILPIDTELQHYFSLLDQYPEALGPTGDYSREEIEIVRDPVKIKEVAAKTGRKVGIVSKDKYWIWLNDAVRFPNGSYGVYGRVLWLKSLTGTPGVAVMAVLPNGKIILNRNFRHATRSWEFELPRGVVNPGESTCDAAGREVVEETGMVLDQLHLLGEMAVDTGFTNTIAKIYMAKVIDQKDASPEDSEAIAGIHAFSVDELKQGLIQGYLLFAEGTINQKIPLRDPFLTFALFQAEIRQLQSSGKH